MSYLTMHLLITYLGCFYTFARVKNATMNMAVQVAFQYSVSPQLLWLGRLGCVPQTARLLVRFPVRAHAWVAGQAPGWGCARGN